MIRLHGTPPARQQPQSGMNHILMQLRSGTGHDFSLYKKSTIGRRIERRMAQHNIEDADGLCPLPQGAIPPKLQLLFKELLINVTSFFRDPEAFVALKEDILPQLLADKPDGLCLSRLGGRLRQRRRSLFHRHRCCAS